MKYADKQDFAQLTGLSLSTINRDVKAGHLREPFNDQNLIDWLVDRRSRCYGLTIEASQFLDDLLNGEPTIISSKVTSVGYCNA
jgi:hypothetical protein